MIIHDAYQPPKRAPNPRLLLACAFFALVWLAAAVGTIVVAVHFIVKCW